MGNVMVKGFGFELEDGSTALLLLVVIAPPPREPAQVIDLAARPTRATMRGELALPAVEAGRRAA